MTDPQPWQPESSPENLAVLGKCGEEAGELGQILARCIIQGIDESEPVTGKPNRQALEEEIADVWATTHLAIARFGLDLEGIEARAQTKARYLAKWLEKLRGNTQASNHVTVTCQQGDLELAKSLLRGATSPPVGTLGGPRRFMPKGFA